MNRQTAIKQLEAINIELYDYQLDLEDEFNGVYLVREDRSSSTTIESYISWNPDSSCEFLVKREGWNPQEAKSLVDAFRVLTGTPMTPEEERQFLTLRSEYDRTLYHFKKAQLPEYRLLFSESCLPDGNPDRVELVLDDDCGSTVLRWDRKCGRNTFTVRDWQDSEFSPVVKAFETFTEALLCFKGVIGS